MSQLRTPKHHFQLINGAHWSNYEGWNWLEMTHKTQKASLYFSLGQGIAPKRYLFFRLGNVKIIMYLWNKFPAYCIAELKICKKSRKYNVDKCQNT